METEAVRAGEGGESTASSECESSGCEDRLASLRRLALLVSAVSIVATAGMGAAAFVVSVLQKSAAAFAFAVGAVLDTLTSVVVAWRFSKVEVPSSRREHGACMALGAVFLVSSAFIAAKSAFGLVQRSQPQGGVFLHVVSVLSAILCAVLALLKFLLGTALSSRALTTDGWNSLAGAVMALAMVVAVDLTPRHPAAWFLDASLGLAMGVAFLTLGIRLLVYSVPRWRASVHYEELP
ncbi:transmembrane protein 163-like [Petromyzon marinus]|uniref:Transmembrane protein 163-like n=1 Tax=Petromyzon marinus TaxID=7757 RepID=A0AAJ7TA78_PETMA|nr:transmembrane protein 163-like [Petromyzon marinus]